MYTVSKSPLIQDHLHLIQDQLLEHTHTMISLIEGKHVYSLEVASNTRPPSPDSGSVTRTYTHHDQLSEGKHVYSLKITSNTRPPLPSRINSLNIHTA